MGSSRRSGDDTSAAGRSPQLVHSRYRSVERLEEPSTGPSQKSAIAVLICLFGPELANLHPNDDIAWDLYMTAKEGANALFCVALSWWMPSRLWRNMMWAVAAIFVTQAMDEAMGANLFANSKWEYPAEIGWLLLTALLTKLYPGENGTDQ